MIDHLVEEFEKDFEMHDFISNPRSGHYILKFSNERNIEFSDYQTCYILKGTMGSVPKEKEAAYFAKMLEANLFGQSTKQAVVGLENENLVLSLVLSPHTSYREFTSKLEDFLNTLEVLDPKNSV